MTVLLVILGLVAVIVAALGWFAAHPAEDTEE